MNNYSVIFGPADVSHSMDDIRKLVSSDQIVAERFAQVSQFSGISIRDLLNVETKNNPFTRLQMISLGLFAGMLGIADRVVSIKGEPCSVGGISLGELVALCFSSAITVKDAVSIILCEQPVKSSPEAVGFVFIPTGSEHLLIEEDLNIAVDYGYVHGGAGKLLMLSGLRDNLLSTAKEIPWELEIISEELCNIAYHSKYRLPAVKIISKLIEGMHLSDCKYPVNTCFMKLDRLKSPEDVRQSLIMNEVETLYVTNLIETQKKDNISQVVCIGPFLRSLNLNFGLPTEYFDKDWIFSSWEK
ncbi:hypothetical protein V4D09_02620 [Vibrio mimicus]|uniref:hypothetical protein n=1 Tax=Vibrio mimicus TaxID=674 RepID=UPI002F920CE4